MQLYRLHSEGKGSIVNQMMEKQGLTPKLHGDERDLQQDAMMKTFILRFVKVKEKSSKAELNQIIRWQFLLSLNFFFCST